MAVQRSASWGVQSCAAARLDVHEAGERILAIVPLQARTSHTPGSALLLFLMSRGACFSATALLCKPVRVKHSSSASERLLILGVTFFMVSLSCMHSPGLCLSLINPDTEESVLPCDRSHSVREIVLCDVTEKTL